MPKLLPRWVIVGGEDRGGILCREGQELGSAKLPSRLSTGAVVEELKLIGERMHFRRLTGTGPERGWISVFLDHKDLAVRLPMALGDSGPPPGEADKVTMEYHEPRLEPTSAPASSSVAAAPDPAAPESTEPILSLGDAPGAEHQNAGAAAAHAEPGAAEGTTDVPPSWQAYSGDASAGAAPDPARAGAPPEASASWEEADEDKGPPRFQKEAARKIPLDVSFDMKWLVWNEIWRVVNNKLGSLADGQKRSDRFRQAEKDEERSCSHLRKVLEVNAFSNSTVLQVKRQASAGGHAVAAGHARGIWLPAARTEPLEAPSEMEAALWSNVVKAVRTAAVAIHMMAQENWDKAMAFQYDYDQAWKDVEEDPGHHQGY